MRQTRVRTFAPLYAAVWTCTFAISATAATAATTTAPAQAVRIQQFLDSRYSAADVRYSFHTKFNETIDCIDYFAQPGIKALAAAGRRITQLPPPVTLPSIPAGLEDVAFIGSLDDQGRPRKCPDDTVPILKIAADDIAAVGGLDTFLTAHHKSGGHAPAPVPGAVAPPDGAGGGYAHVQQDYNGAGTEIAETWATITVYAPMVDNAGTPHSDHSIAQTWTMGSGPLGIQTIEVGWTVDWSIHAGNQPHLFIFSTNNAYADGCYNNVGSNCLPWIAAPGAVYTPGQALPSSTFNTSPQLFQPVVYNGDEGYGAAGWNIIGIGVYPSTNYFGNMQSFASLFTVGGEIYDSNQGDSTHTSPPPTGPYTVPMGSGAEPDANVRGTETQAAGWLSPTYESGSYTGVWTFDQGVSTSFNSPYSTAPTAYGAYDQSSTTGWIYFGDLTRTWGSSNFGFSFSPIGDWASGSYKGECGPGQAITGVSASSSFSNALECGDVKLSPTYSGCYSRTITTGHDNRGDTDGGLDWDHGYTKDECSVHEYIAGVAQSTSGAFKTILCCAGSVNHNSCDVQKVGSSSGYGSGPDFDVNFPKARCPDGQYAAGASSVPGGIHALYCCSP
ncbi:MAG TPA: neprosin family prolyl endopeptidase [Polyangia bacterium]|jgi:hypothetical protein|nr:neprosin family prolyl endopeptidase [Polyangia bacterium]